MFTLFNNTFYNAVIVEVFVEGILNEVSLFNLPFDNDEFINQTWEIHQKVHEI